VQPEPALPVGLVQARLKLRSPSCVGLTAKVGFRDFAATVRGWVSEQHLVPLQHERRASFPHHSRDHIGNLQSMLPVAAANAAAAAEYQWYQ
jgi:hypothetical protein